MDYNPSNLYVTGVASPHWTFWTPCFDIGSFKFGRHDGNDLKDFYDWRFVEIQHFKDKFNWVNCGWKTNAVLLSTILRTQKLRVKSPFVLHKFEFMFSDKSYPKPFITLLLDFLLSVSITSFDSEFIDYARDYHVLHRASKGFHRIGIVCLNHKLKFSSKHCSLLENSDGRHSRNKI